MMDSIADTDAAKSLISSSRGLDLKSRSTRQVWLETYKETQEST